MSTDCPSMAELLDDEPRALEHARGCRRCQAILALAGEGEEEGTVALPSFEAAPLPDRQPLAERRVGELVSVGAGAVGGPLLLAAVLARVGEGSLEVAPLSGEVAAAGEWDLILAGEDGPLGYPVIAEVWNHGRVAEAQVAESFGALPEPATSALLALYAAVYTTGPPAGLPAGVPVASELDPRFGFQQAEAQRAQAFWAGGEEAAAGEEAVATVGIGGYLEDWFRRSGADPVEVAVDLGWREPDLISVMAGQIAPLRPAHSPERLADLFALTDIAPETLEDELLAGDLWRQFAITQQPDAGRLAVHRRSPLGFEARLGSLRGRTEPAREEPSRAQRMALETYVREIVALVEEKRD